MDPVRLPGESAPATGGILPDWLIGQRIGIQPFEREQIQEGVISYGVTSYGYDARCGYKFKIFTNVWGSTIDPKNFDPRSFVDVDLCEHQWDDERQPKALKNIFPVCVRCGCHDGPDTPTLCMGLNHIIVPPNSFALAETLETFSVPRDVLCVCVGKSTYARCGIVVNVTPLEPEWRGKVTVEISNTTPLPAKIYAGEGIMQILFFQGVAPCKQSYADKKGKYQDQDGLTLPCVVGGQRG